ncbi:MAG: helix-turn-helix transcriptional regulator [Fibrobacteria bacterium]
MFSIFPGKRQPLTRIATDLSTAYRLHRRLDRSVDAVLTSSGRIEHAKTAASCENAPAPAGLELLSPRERQVAALAELGRSNKVIAYELGLGHSTVRVLLARAAGKPGPPANDG